MKAQRQKWSAAYGISEREIIELFAEFAALMMLSRQESLENHPDSVQSIFKLTAEARDDLASVLPFSGSVRAYQQRRRDQRMELTKLSAREMRDYRVPIEIFRQNSLAKTREFLRNRVLRALGVDADSKREKVDFESFLLLKAVMNTKKQSDQ